MKLKVNNLQNVPYNFFITLYVCLIFLILESHIDTMPSLSPDRINRDEACSDTQVLPTCKCTESVLVTQITNLII